MPQAEIADKLGVTSTTVARWERDEKNPPPFLERALNDIRRELAENEQN